MNELNCECAFHLIMIDVFVQLSQKQLLSSIHLNLFCALVSICTSDHMDLHNFLFCSKVVGNSFEYLSVLHIF